MTVTDIDDDSRDLLMRARTPYVMVEDTGTLSEKKVLDYLRSHGRTTAY